MKAQGMLSPESERRHDGHDFGATASGECHIILKKKPIGESAKKRAEQRPKVRQLWKFLIGHMGSKALLQNAEFLESDKEELAERHEFATAGRKREWENPIWVSDTKNKNKKRKKPQ
ncbi:hypothetical protein RUM44_002200 [Polyplax serrata]|uniref:Uncharacterized protein n=1 Tax=Polyplax serrata TaxID=468196 RepID=A0ABR1ANQ4_POLSC